MPPPPPTDHVGDQGLDRADQPCPSPALTQKSQERSHRPTGGWTLPCAKLPQMQD